jgi:hypothetical protein
VSGTIRRTRLAGAGPVDGLGTVSIASAVGDVDVTIGYEIPGPAASISSLGSMLDREPACPGTLMIDDPFSACYETGLRVADLEPGDHLYTVAATIDGQIVSGSTVFTIPAA